MRLQEVWYIDYCSHKHSHILSFYVLALLFYWELFIHLVYYYGLFAFSFVPFVSKLLPSDGDGYKGHTSCVFIIVAVCLVAAACCRLMFAPAPLTDFSLSV